MICNMNNVLDNPEFTQENESILHLPPITSLHLHVKPYMYTNGTLYLQWFLWRQFWYFNTQMVDIGSIKKQEQKLFSIFACWNHFSHSWLSTIVSLFTWQDGTCTVGHTEQQLSQTTMETTLYVHIAYCSQTFHCACVYTHNRCIICTSVE